MDKKYKAPTVKKAFQILDLIAASDHGLKISDLSKTLNISKSTVHGITMALEEIGAVQRDVPTKRYTPGLTLFELGRAAYARIDLKLLARPLMEDLMLKTRESVFLGVKNGDHVTIVDIVESMQDLKITSPIGTTIPLMAGAIGKVFLSSMTDEQALAYMCSKELACYTENTITDQERFVQEIRSVRNTGYAFDNEEYIQGVRAVASPIRSNGHLTAAIWVVGFTPSMDQDKMKAVAKQITRTAQEIQHKIESQTSGYHILH
jgi:DNA-binding IclR family transcriptional regulator